MDFQILLTGLVIILVCVLPFVLASILKKQKLKSRLKKLNQLANSHQGKISLSDFSDHFSIGLDEFSKKLFYINGSNIQVIDLKDFKSVISVSNEGKTIDDNSLSGMFYDKLSLVFLPKDKNVLKVELEFYNCNNSLLVRKEKDLLLKWEHLLKTML